MNRCHNPKYGCLIVALPTLNQVKLTPPAWTGQRTWPVHFLDVPKGHQLQATQKSHQGLYNLTMLDTPCYIRIETIHGTLLCFPQQVARATHTHKHTQIQKNTHTHNGLKTRQTSVEMSVKKNWHFQVFCARIASGSPRYPCKVIVACGWSAISARIRQNSHSAGKHRGKQPDWLRASLASTYNILKHRVTSFASYNLSKEV